MPRLVCSCLTIAAATLGLALHAGALPHVSVAPQVYKGMFGKVHLPRINVAKGVKAVAYPVTKTVVSGGKAVISGGQTAVKVYGTLHTLDPSGKGLPSLSRLK